MTESDLLCQNWLGITAGAKPLPMCGRKYAHEELTWGDYRDMLSLVPSVPASNFQPNYNIAPTHEVPVGFADAEGAHRLALMRWGLVPHSNRM